MDDRDYHYRKKRSLGLFELRIPREEFQEILRARVGPKGDVYVMPHVGFAADLHVSHHASGIAHWTTAGQHIRPLDGAADLANAFSYALAVRTKFNVAALAIAASRDLTQAEIETGLAELLRYVPYPFAPATLAAQIFAHKIALCPLLDLMTEGRKRLLAAKKNA